MNPEPYIAALETNAPIIAALVRAMPAEDVRWKPTPNDWSVLEVVNHLADEDIKDFGARLDYVLHRLGEDPPVNDPEEEIIARTYNARDPGESLARFLAAREQSLVWLRSLAAPDWERAWTHRSGRTLRAGDILVAWAAHDLLHLRQLVELQFASRAKAAAPYSVDYAGDW